MDKAGIFNDSDDGGRAGPGRPPRRAKGSLPGLSDTLATAYQGFYRCTITIL